MRSDKEFFVETIADEIPRFERFFKAMPQDKLDWRPHEKSRTAMEIVTVIANEAAMLPLILKTGKVDFSAMPQDSAPKSFDQTVAAYITNLKATSEAAKNATDEEWMLPATMGDWQADRGTMIWGLFLDGVHHRGQLSTYIRPMGGKVPPIYGPSGDSEG